jgi:hypothetical protein
MTNIKEPITSSAIEHHSGAQLNSLRSAVMRKIFIASVGLILTLADLVLAYTSNHPASYTKLTVSFLAYTNDGSGVRCCSFVLSNSGPRSIYRISSYRITGPDGGNRDTITNAPLSFNYRDRVLRTGDSEVIVVAAPVGRTAWRARFDYWTYQGPVGSMAENCVMSLRRWIGMKITDVRQWGTGMSEVMAE